MTEISRETDFLAHHVGDGVAMAVRDAEPNTVEGGHLRGPATITLQPHDTIPLGHKVALTDLEAGQAFIE